MGFENKKVAIIGVSAILLVAMVVAVTVGITVNHNGGGGNDNSGKNDKTGQLATSTKAIKAICQPTDYKEDCVKSLKSAKDVSDPRELIKIGFNYTMKLIHDAAEKSTTLKELEKDPAAAEALANCKSLMNFAIDELKDSVEKLENFDVARIDEVLADIRIWLSATITYQETCLDGFENITTDAGKKMADALKTSRRLSSNALAMVTDLSTVLGDLQIPGFKRRLLLHNIPVLGHEDDFPVLGRDSEMPSWVDMGRRRLLQTHVSEIKPNIVVAQDGTGKYKTINEALNHVPLNSNKTFVIYIKEGVYKEYVKILKKMTNVMLIGDGPTKTRITGNKNKIDGWSTFNSSTVTAFGYYFTAKGIGFENTAGADKHQAVALLVQSEKSIFYNCAMDGFQDTLYAHTNRQFYRDCTVSGTIDFVFGDAAAVFQNCTFLVRKPSENQQNIFTAQGRKDRRAVTGLVFQNCNFTAHPELVPFKKDFKSYLGRPWKEFSRTIIMNSFIDDVVEPEGYLPWMGTFALDTLYYTEYNCKGPGSGKNLRVKWKGIKTITKKQALVYTPGKFLTGDEWIKPSGVPYTSGLLA